MVIIAACFKTHNNDFCIIFSSRSRANEYVGIRSEACMNEEEVKKLHNVEVIYFIKRVVLYDGDIWHSNWN